VKTVCLQIGNGDDKLSQSRWHEFVVQIKAVVDDHCSKVHFFGGPENWCAQQNVALVFEVQDSSIDRLKTEVTNLRKKFLQESAAWMEGQTLFL
jgi:hypothetical protein